VSALVIGRHVDLRLAGYSQDRLVADMVLRDGRNVAALLVAEGVAWVDPAHRPAGASGPHRASAQTLVVVGVVLAMSSGAGG
jgi:endonuclease YncB( thermonuclease family)